MTTYISLLNKIEDFFDNHLQVKKFKGEFREQMPNFSTIDEKYPLVFVTLTGSTSLRDTHQHTLDVYCVDIIQKDRANINTIVSDCELILRDLIIYFRSENDYSVDILGDPAILPLNNFDLDYVAGCVATITFESNGYEDCLIPYIS